MQSWLNTSCLGLYVYVSQRKGDRGYKPEQKLLLSAASVSSSYYTSNDTESSQPVYLTPGLATQHTA